MEATGLRPHRGRLGLRRGYLHERSEYRSRSAFFDAAAITRPLWLVPPPSIVPRSIPPAPTSCYRLPPHLHFRLPSSSLRFFASFAAASSPTPTPTPSSSRARQPSTKSKPRRQRKGDGMAALEAALDRALSWATERPYGPLNGLHDLILRQAVQPDRTCAVLILGAFTALLYLSFLALQRRPNRELRQPIAAAIAAVFSYVWLNYRFLRESRGASEGCEVASWRAGELARMMCSSCEVPDSWQRLSQADDRNTSAAAELCPDHGLLSPASEVLRAG